MELFDQKIRFAARPLGWLFTGGRSTYESTERFFRLLSEEFNSPEPRNLEDGKIAARLLPLRGDFHQILQHTESVPVLQRYQLNINPLIRSIAIWLLSRHASRFVLLGIEDAGDDFSPMVRKRVARALRRLEAREQLAQMAASYPDDDAVQWFATFRANPKSYRDRLDTFVKTVDPTGSAPVEGPSRMPLWFRDEYWSGAPAKSIEFIRTILWRIHRLVRG